MSDAENGRTVTVTSKGQATIPKEFREKLQIDTPGRVRFVENEDGEVVIRPVQRPAEIRGELVSEAADDRAATDLLRAERDEELVDQPEE
ncbi:AbrB/MazE/SpoVT family DNA-binding domain-containing protein [Halorientalis pallida]|uniref:AbrB/MazE/SpoVT family DNA-binding domain-containing protein n=1 Tax=Halorientalis pallida TaxID=2479928 RepID=A0A498KW74_9EURY|nr:AbrB/MazE/SpoVT family DNA-binding domain-containing protein [Halorientalis pallida]RXK49498.1 AbrB/MazE/SpoVT family DNA-binding domain-containing protein [Halorientalis pallida]